MEQTIKEVESDRDYWLQLEKYLPWKLYGWSFKRTASYHTTDGKNVLNINQFQFEDLIKAFKDMDKS